MAIDRIPASALPPPVSSRPGAPVFDPALFAAAAETGAANDALAVALVAVAEGAVASAAPAAAEAQPAMRTDQLLLARQLHYAQPDAATLGAAWRVMVRAFGEQEAAQREQARGQHLPGGLFGADPAPAAVRDAQPATPDPALWHFPVYAWERRRMMLSVLEKEQDRTGGSLQRRTAAVLRLDLILPELGHVAVQMQPLGESIVLDLAAAEDAGMDYLRALAPQLVAAVAQAGLAIARCRLGRSLGSARGRLPDRAQASALPFALFKAMAAVAILLSRPA